MKTFRISILVLIGLTLAVLVSPLTLHAQRDDRVLDPGKMVQDLSDRVVQLEVYLSFAIPCSCTVPAIISHQPFPAFVVEMKSSMPP